MIGPTHPEKPLVQLHSSVGKPRIHEYAALEYAPNLRGFVYYSAVDGARLLKISPSSGKNMSRLTNSTWAWESLLHRKNSLDPVADASSESAYETNTSHTFGRFRIATYDDIDLVILVRHVDSPVYAMRMT